MEQEVLLFHRLRGQVRRFSEPDNRGRILGPTAAAILLSAADEHGVER